MMQWSFNWAFWRRNDLADGATGRAGLVQVEPCRIEEWEARLVEEGVSSEWALQLARKLEPLHHELGYSSAATLIRAATAAVEVQAEAHAYVEWNMSEVREVERLLGAFSGELGKLDEVLEVLAAYAQRMRTKPAKKAAHTLH
jgi:hypothetical protein